MGKQLITMIVITVIVVGAGVLLFMNEEPTDRSDKGFAVDPNHEGQLVRDNAYQTGNPDAKVTMVEFSDLQCSACAAAFPALKTVQELYSADQLNFVYRHFPLNIHKNGQVAGLAGEAAREQEKFEEMEEMLFTRQSQWSALGNPINKFVDYAQELGLNTDQFREAVESKKYKDIVELGMQDGFAFGVNSTPTLFINEKPYRKVLSLEELQTIIDAVLAEE